MHRQGRDRGKRKEEKGRAIGREARARELTSKALLVLGTSAPLLLSAHIPQPVSGVSWLAGPAPWPGWAPSPHCFVRVSLSPFCSPRHLEVLSSPLAHTPNPHTGASVFVSCLAPLNCHFTALSTAAWLVPLSQWVPSLFQAHFPSSCLFLLRYSLTRERDRLKTSTPGSLLVLPGRAMVEKPEARGGTTWLLGTSSQLVTQ